MAKKGRPSKFTKALGERICEAMVTRNELDQPQSLRDVCKQPGMPAESTVYAWLLRHTAFQEMYVRARETIAEMNANDIVCISDTDPDPQSARVRIEARKWFASKIAPKKYGEKLALTDADGGVLQVKVVA